MTERPIEPVAPDAPRWPRREKYKELARSWLYTGKRMLGVFPRACPICGATGRFVAAGNPPRFDARCPDCGSFERHRLFALWLARNPGEVAGRRVLHIAPEAILRPMVRDRAARYVDGDRDPDRASTALDVEALAFQDGAFDTVICNHVLEHVDHRKALAEFHRVLAPGGLAVLSFPLIEGWTESYENPAAREPAERVLHFGQWDHVRFFGADARDAIRAAGFDLSEETAVEPEVRIYGLIRGEKLFLARKPAAPV